LVLKRLQKYYFFRVLFWFCGRKIHYFLKKTVALVLFKIVNIYFEISSFSRA
jgi:hypothetical protein